MPACWYDYRMVYEPRTYRRRVTPAGLDAFEVVWGETDLHVCAHGDLRDEATAAVRLLRAELDAYVAAHPHFGRSLAPVPVEPDAPATVRSMAEAGQAAGVGPMAAVAGALAEAVARDLMAHSEEVIVENGGDVYIITRISRQVLVHAGASPLSNRVALAIEPDDTPLAVCTSSATVGPSLSLGSADAVTILARSGALADAAASAVGNLVHGPGDIERALERARGIDGVTGALVIIGEHLGAAGHVRLVRV